MHVSRDVDGNPPPSPGVVDLFWAFLTVSCSAFGGALPWAQRMIVRNRRWMRPDEFTDVLALCQFLPGPNVVNVAVTVGERFRGLPGAVAALLGLLVLPVSVVSAFAALYGRFGHTDALRGIFAGVAAAAAGVAVAMTAELARPLVRRRPVTAAPVMLVAFIAVGLMRWPVPWVLLALSPISIALVWRSRA